MATKHSANSATKPLHSTSVAAASIRADIARVSAGCPPVQAPAPPSSSFCTPAGNWPAGAAASEGGK
jgi:hypothetical protein